MTPRVSALFTPPVVGSMLDQIGGLLAVALITLLSVVIGHILWRRLRKQEATGTALEQLVEDLAVGLSVMTMLGLALAYVRVFSLFALSSAGAFAAVVAFLTSRGKLQFPRLVLTRSEWVAIAIGAAFPMFCVAMRFDDVEGIRDEGVYAASAVELAATGEFGWTDPLIKEHGVSRVEHLLQQWGDRFHGKPRWERFSGFYVNNAAEAYVYPQFLHAYEMWMAAAYRAAGPQATQCVNGGFGAIALLAFFCFVRRLLNAPTAFAAMLLLACNPLQLWFARSTANEMFVQALLWSFLSIYVRLLGHDKRASAGEIALTFLPIATAAATKLAMWPVLAVLVLDAGMRMRAHQVKASSFRSALVFTFYAVLVYVHARAFAHFYLYGSWVHGVGQRGVAWEQLPMLWILGVWASFAGGSLFQPAFVRFREKFGSRKRRLLFACAIFGVAALVFLLQWRVHSLGPRRDIWNENTNFFELSLYLTAPGVLLAIGGLLALMALLWHSGRVGLLVLLMILTASLLYKRNIEAIHPWGARRWVPVVLPMMALGMCAPVFAILRNATPARRLAAAAYFVAALVLSLAAAPQLIMVRHNRGLIPQLDQFAAHLQTNDFILSHPTPAIMQYAPWLKARRNIDLYVQPADDDAWTSTIPLLRTAASKKRRILYISDSPLTQSSERAHVTRLVAEHTINHPVFPDQRNHLAPTSRVQLSNLFTYELVPQLMEDDFALFRPLHERADPPIEIGMGEQSRMFLDEIYDENPLPDGSAFRWTTGASRIYIGKMLKFPIKAAKLRMTIRIHTGRPQWNKPIPVTVNLNTTALGRDVKIATFNTGPEWQDYSAEFDASLLLPQSHLFVHSFRHRIGETTPPGKLGVMVHSVRLEPVQ